MRSASSGCSSSRMRLTRAMWSLHLESRRLDDGRPARQLLGNEAAGRGRSGIEDRLEAGGHQDVLKLPFGNVAGGGVPSPVDVLGGDGRGRKRAFDFSAHISGRPAL